MAGNREMKTLPLRMAVREVLADGGADIAKNARRFASFVMDVTDSEDAISIVFSNNCDDELLAPLNEFMAAPSTGSAATAAVNTEELLAKERLVQPAQARRVACELLFGACAFVGVQPPDEVVANAVGKPIEQVRSIDFDSLVPDPPPGEQFEKLPDNTTKPSKRKWVRRVLIAGGVVCVLVIAGVVGVNLWRTHVQDVAVGTWGVAEVSLDGSEDDQDYWEQYYTSSRSFELKKGGDCTYVELPERWDGEWTVGFPFVSSAVTIELEDDRTIDLSLDGEKLVFRDGSLSIAYAKGKAASEEEATEPSSAPLVGLWQVSKTVGKDGTSLDEAGWEEARKNGNNITLRISDDRTFEWRYSEELIEGTWKMVGEREAVLSTTDGQTGSFKVSEDDVLTFAFSPESYGEYRRV